MVLGSAGVLSPQWWRSFSLFNLASILRGQVSGVYGAWGDWSGKKAIGLRDAFHHLFDNLIMCLVKIRISTRQNPSVSAKSARPYESFVARMPKWSSWWSLLQVGLRTQWPSASRIHRLDFGWRFVATGLQPDSPIEVLVPVAFPPNFLNCSKGVGKWIMYMAGSTPKGEDVS